MKQIRKGVFETNSSSVHSLTFTRLNTKEIDIKSIVGDRIVLGKNEYNWSVVKDWPHIITPETDYQTRLDIIWSCVWCVKNYNDQDITIRDYAIFKERFTKLFKKYGVEVEFNEDFNMKVECNKISGLINCLILNYINNYHNNDIVVDEDIIGFIFSEYINMYYIEDDCDMPEDKILNKYTSTFPEDPDNLVEYYIHR